MATQYEYGAYDESAWGYGEGGDAQGYGQGGGGYGAAGEWGDYDGGGGYYGGAEEGYGAAGVCYAAHGGAGAYGEGSVAAHGADAYGEYSADVAAYANGTYACAGWDAGGSGADAGDGEWVEHATGGYDGWDASAAVAEGEGPGAAHTVARGGGAEAAEKGVCRICKAPMKNAAATVHKRCILGPGQDRPTAAGPPRPPATAAGSAGAAATAPGTARPSGAASAGGGGAVPLVAATAAAASPATVPSAPCGCSGAGAGAGAPPPSNAVDGASVQPDAVAPVHSRPDAAPTPTGGATTGVYPRRRVSADPVGAAPPSHVEGDGAAGGPDGPQAHADAAVPRRHSVSAPQDLGVGSGAFTDGSYRPGSFTRDRQRRGTDGEHSPGRAASDAPGATVARATRGDDAAPRATSPSQVHQIVPAPPDLGVGSGTFTDGSYVPGDFTRARRASLRYDQSGRAEAAGTAAAHNGPAPSTERQEAANVERAAPGAAETEDAGAAEAGAAAVGPTDVAAADCETACGPAVGEAAAAAPAGVRAGDEGAPAAAEQPATEGPTVHATDADIAAWWRLFNFCDEDRSGAISRAEIGSRMSPMVGQFEWDDDNADGLMEFAEFVQCVYALPVSKRHTCLRWAQGYCPDKTRGRPPPAVQQRRASGPFRGDPSALPARVRDPGADAEDRRAWARLHRFIDADGSGAIGRREIEAKMAPMVGAFEWEDGDADGEMDFEEFVRCMTALPANKRHTCLLWAKMQCPA